MKWVNLGPCVRVPENTEALLFDLDGVIIDSLSLDINVCGELLNRYTGRAITLSSSFVQSVFALDIETFWRCILQEQAIELSELSFQQLLAEYEQVRRDYPFALNPGVSQLLQGAKAANIPMAVVSNNRHSHVIEIVERANIVGCFELVVGNDGEYAGHPVRKKPAPDSYLVAIDALRQSGERCVVLEDSVIGAQAGLAAGCFTIGVATGGATAEELRQCIGSRGEVYRTFLERYGS